MQVAKYLGQRSRSLLCADPYKHWPVERLVDNDADPPYVGYTFVGCGLQVLCDIEDEVINTLFLESDTHDGTVLSAIPFSLSRDDVIDRFGPPTASGEPMFHPILGNFGPWDRFDQDEYAVHIQYSLARPRIEKVSLMRNDVVPSTPR